MVFYERIIQPLLYQDQSLWPESTPLFLAKRNFGVEGLQIKLEDHRSFKSLAKGTEMYRRLPDLKSVNSKVIFKILSYTGVGLKEEENMYIVVQSPGHFPSKR